jgi:BirA family transcriptional regulator, biotin operon repressor / biotin---[acetyl-CoA-carboxylase] ligase
MIGPMDEGREQRRVVLTPRHFGTLGCTILRFDSLPSTNIEAIRQASDGAPEGLCVVAREQTAGRGRQQRTWVSPAGAGLYFSIVLRPRFDVASWPLITLMAGLAVSDALLFASDLATDIKWPNDIYARGRKLCGILAEAVETEPGRAVVVGIGINLREAALPAHLQDTATSVEACTGSVPDMESIIDALLSSIERWYALLQELHGPERILDGWTARSTYASGRRVRISITHESIEGVTRGLEPDGALRVETDGGEIRIVRAGDVLALRTEATGVAQH